jgi:hypothetical protein
MIPTVTQRHVRTTGLDIEALQHANAELQQHNAALSAQLDERDRALTAARATIRDLMIQMNSIR